MKNTITRILYVGIILVVSLCLHLGGCQKKLVRDRHKMGVVEGFVKDSLSAIPIAGADVFLDDRLFEPYPKTDSSGYYRVDVVLTDVRLVKITIKAQGYKTKDKNIMLKPNHIQRLDFFLVKEGGS